MATYRELGDAIEGERIVFECRRCDYGQKKIIQGSSSHRATAGKLDNAKCTIAKKFRHIPDDK